MNIIGSWVNPEKGRWYLAIASRDLLGYEGIILRWGGKRRRGYQERFTTFPIGDVKGRNDFLRRLAARRHRRGYQRLL